MWVVVRWAKDPWRLKVRMGRLWGTHGRSLETESDKVDGLVSDLFGQDAAGDTGHTSELMECPFDEEVLLGWVWDALSGTRNNSAASPDGIGYRLLKTVRNTRLGTKVLEEVVATLRDGYIPDRWRDMQWSSSRSQAGTSPRPKTGRPSTSLTV